MPRSPRAFLLVSAARAALRATDARDVPALGDGHDDLPPPLAARAPLRGERLTLRAAAFADRPAETGQQDASDRLSGQPLDGAHGRLVERRDERDGAPRVAGPPRATDAMHVVFGRDGHVVV